MYCILQLFGHSRWPQKSATGQPLLVLHGCSTGVFFHHSRRLWHRLGRADSSKRSNCEQEALNREKTVAKLRKRTAEQDDEIRENEERIQQLVAGRAEDNASLAERARIIADQDQKLRQLQAQTDRLLTEKTQQVVQLEQGAQKDRLVERLRGTLSDVAERVQGSLDEIKGSWGMNTVEKPTK
jgi:septal ring factor EnvC (AmiA/AmiB activator)